MAWSKLYLGLAAVICVAIPAWLSAGTPKPQTQKDFDCYVQSAEAFELTPKPVDASPSEPEVIAGGPPESETGGVLTIDLGALQSVVTSYEKQQGQPPAGLDVLLAEGWLNAMPVEPYGGHYVFDATTGNVTTTSGRKPARLAVSEMPSASSPAWRRLTRAAWAEAAMAAVASPVRTVTVSNAVSCASSWPSRACAAATVGCTSCRRGPRRWPHSVTAR